MSDERKIYEQVGDAMFFLPEYAYGRQKMLKLVIDIPESTYAATCEGNMLPPDVKNVVEAIKNGTPLTDADTLEKLMREYIDRNI